MVASSKSKSPGILHTRGREHPHTALNLRAIAQPLISSCAEPLIEDRSQSATSLGAASSLGSACDTDPVGGALQLSVAENLATYDLNRSLKCVQQEILNQKHSVFHGDASPSDPNPT